MPKKNGQLPLVVDASSTPLHVGIPNGNGWEKMVTDQGQAMDGLFRAIGTLFEERSDEINSVNVIYFCCGPGSTLGLRLAATLVRTMMWDAKGGISLFQYNALDVASILADSSAEFIQAPFRMGKRFLRSGKAGMIGKKEILTENDAVDNYPNSLHLKGPRQISIDLPEKKILDYDLKKIRGLEDLSLISESADQAVPYSPEPATFTKWKGFIPAKK